MTIDTEIENSEFFESIFKTVIAVLKQPVALCVGLNLVDKTEIQTVNRIQRGIDNVTDVLSFPTLNLKVGEIIDFKKYSADVDLFTQELYLGDILICDEVSKEQAIEYGHSEERERGYLFCHALLHLFGYDHMTDADRAIMRETEEKVLAMMKLERNRDAE